MFTKINTTNGYIYKVENDEKLKKCATWAAKTAFYKASYTADTWQKRPNKYAKFVDIFYGDFAKNIVRSFIESNAANLEIVEYDLIRTDDFKNHDLFDLKVKGREIEVKSSLEKYTKSTNEIYDNRRIIVNVYGSHETLSDFVVQVFFVPNDLRRFEVIENFNKQNPNMTDEQTKSKCREEMDYACGSTSIYVCGWINKEMELNAIKEAKSGSSFGVKNYGSNARFRRYANVMIKDSKHMDELISVLQNLSEKNF